MRKKFKSEKKSLKLIKILSYLFIFYIFIGVFYNSNKINIKEFVYNNTLNKIVRKKSNILNFIENNIANPKNILYTSFNNLISKDNLSVFNEYDNKNSYEEEKSVYVEDPKEEDIKEPLVYIYNTHQLEEYNSTLFNSYNIVPNVMIASYTLREYLIDKGINTIVETNNIKEYLNNNGLTYYHSYRATKHYMKQAIEKYPTLNYFIDLHRDSANINVTLLEANNKRYARVLFVIGTDNPYYEKNLSITNEINSKMEKKLPGISRGIMKTGDGSGDYVFNQDLHPNMILLEMGGVDNTIEEVYNTLEVVSDVLKEVIHGGNYG